VSLSAPPRRDTLDRPPNRLMETTMNRPALTAPALALAGLLACHPAAAQAGSALDPNYYRLRGPLGGVEIVLDQHLPTPTLTYRAGARTRTFSGAGITIETTAIGRLVSVTTKFMPDVDFLTLSFLIPDMKIPAGAASLAFSSVALITDHLTPFTAPPVSGVTEVYSPPVVLTGVAKAVP
jgi:hypothetical protein